MHATQSESTPMKTLAAVMFALTLSAPVAAQEVIGGYAAYIGRNDLYNSNGTRLTEAWQVLRQDRANYHRFGIRQTGDEGDPYFSDANNRAALEQMLMRGTVHPVARRRILEGGASVYVTIYGRGGRGTHVDVDVFD